MKLSRILTALVAATPFSTANADALLFPYVASGDTVATIVSVVNKSSGGQLFLNYFTKQSLTNTASCTDQLRQSVDSAPNDLVSFEVNDTFKGNVANAQGGPLFNDPGTNPNYGGSNFTMGPLNKPQRAFLIVDDNTNTGEALYGEAMLLETQGGAAWGYRAYNPADDSTTSPMFAAGTADGTWNAYLGEVLDSIAPGANYAAVTLLPTSEWETRFFVTPVSRTNQRACTNCNASITLARDRTGAASANGLFDRDGNPLVGANTVEVICVSGVSLTELLPANLQATVASQGGWGYVRVDAGTANVSGAVPAAVVMKLEFNKAQSISPLATNRFAGTVNTAVWLQSQALRNQATGKFEGTSGF